MRGRFASMKKADGPRMDLMKTAMNCCDVGANDKHIIEELVDE